MDEPSSRTHEAREFLSPEVLDRHRAVVSLKEELEAIDWYDQRVEVAADPELKAILAHNRDEEKEHAAFLLEWLRRRDAGLDRNLRAALFRDGDILSHEHEVEGASGRGGNGDLGIGGTLRRTTP